jgi:1-acyl-sn-glycerol-3-phosphate acyltransferase
MKKLVANACAILIFKIWKSVFGLNFEERGFHGLPSGAKIIAINHTNASDVIFLPLLLSRMPRMIAQGDLFDIPVFGNILKATGQIPVDPKNPTRAFHEARELLLRGETLVIFPEGQLVPFGQRVRAKSGAVRLSIATGTPIIPLGMYTDPMNLEALRLTKDGREREGLYQVKGACYLRFGAAWKPTSIDRKPSQVHALTDELMNRIYALVEQGRKESQNVRLQKDLKPSALTLIERLFPVSKINYR